MRWGFPPPPNLGKVPVTNVRNLASPYWHGWLKAEWRCLVPATSFCEWTDSRPKIPHWFALDETRPVFCFAGIWRPWTGERKGETREHRLFSFLMTDANDIVRPIHAEANASAAYNSRAVECLARRLYRRGEGAATALPNRELRIVAKGEKSDGGLD